MSQRNRQPKEPIAALPAYPIMPITDIGNTLEALGIPSTIEDLSKPTGPGVQMIYAALLDVLMSAPVEMIEGPKAMLMGGLEYKELYGDALSFTMFFSHCRTLAGICGIEDFRMSDLTRPEPARFRSQMSGIMNFAKFREERLHAQSNLAARNQQQKDEVARLHHELGRVEQEIEEIKAKHAQDKPLTEKAGTRNENLRQALYDLRVEQVRISAVTEDLKAARQAVMDSAAQRTHELTTLQSQNASAKSRLVQSPERIKKHISEMSFTVSQERASLQSHQRKARELAHRMEVIGGMEVDLRGLIDLEKGIEVQRARVEEARRGVMSLRGKVESQQIEGKSMEAKLGQLERQLQHAQEKLSRQKEAFEDTKAKAATRYSNLREAYVHEATARKVWQRERDQLLAEKKAIEDEMEDFVAHHEAEINAMLQEYWTMRKQAEDYMNTVTVKLGLELR